MKRYWKLFLLITKYTSPISLHEEKAAFEPRAQRPIRPVIISGRLRTFLLTTHVHGRGTPALVSLAHLHLGWREALWNCEILCSKNTTQCPSPGLELGPLDCLPYSQNTFKRVNCEVTGLMTRMIFNYLHRFQVWALWNEPAKIKDTHLFVFSSLCSNSLWAGTSLNHARTAKSESAGEAITQGEAWAPKRQLAQPHPNAVWTICKMAAHETSLKTARRLAVYLQGLFGER